MRFARVQLIVMVVLAGCFDGKDTGGDTAAAEDEGTTGDPPDDSGPDLESGEQLFYFGCTGCHGQDGRGTSGPDLYWVVPRYSVEHIAEVVELGTGNMPPVYSDPNDIADVTAYVVATFG